MPVSKNRKGQKKKAQNRAEQIKAAQRNFKQRMLEQYLEEQRISAEKTQKFGEMVENTDIDVVDLGVDMSVDDFELQDDINIVSEAEIVK